MRVESSLDNTPGEHTASSPKEEYVMRTYARFTEEYRRFALAVLTIAAIGTVFFLSVTQAAAAGQTTESQQTVVGDLEIQAAIDGNIDQAAADRLAIQAMLQREDVRQVAGAAGLDLERAYAAAGVLSGASLEMMADQAREINDSGLVGGEGRVVITTTGIIIILLILILLLN
jgi:hypothetical protein